jgi:hypothetical protein
MAVNSWRCTFVQYGRKRACGNVARLSTALTCDPFIPGPRDVSPVSHHGFK